MAVWALEGRQHPQLFAMGVDPVFLREFRDYEKRWQCVVARIFLAGLQVTLKADPAKGVDFEKIEIENADHEAKQLTEALDFVIQFAWAKVIQNDRDFLGRRAG